MTPLLEAGCAIQYVDIGAEKLWRLLMSLQLLNKQTDMSYFNVQNVTIGYVFRPGTGHKVANVPSRNSYGFST